MNTLKLIMASLVDGGSSLSHKSLLITGIISLVIIILAVLIVPSYVN